MGLSVYLEKSNRVKIKDLDFTRTADKFFIFL